MRSVAGHVGNTHLVFIIRNHEDITLIKSSSMPPAVVTITSTMRCCARKRSCSRTPLEMRLDVNPRNTLQRTAARAAALWYSSPSSSDAGSSVSRHRIYVSTASGDGRPRFTGCVRRCIGSAHARDIAR